MTEDDEKRCYYGILCYDEMKNRYFIDNKELISGMWLGINLYGSWLELPLLYQENENQWLFADLRFNLPGFIGHEVRFSRRYLPEMA